jgi:predicted esterase
MIYEEFRNQVFRRYTSRDYAPALAMLKEHAGEYPENVATLLYWRACLEGLLNNSGAALRTLKELIVRGLWIDPELVRNDTDLAILKENREFATVLAAFAESQKIARQEARPRLLILQPAASTPAPYPVVIAIHGRNDNGRNFADIWRPLTESGWLVALPTSSNILASESFGWEDHAQAEAELSAHYARLDNDFPLDDTRILLSGFSQGGGLSIWLTLSQAIPATGFLALAPYLHGLETLETPKASPPVLPKGMIVTGDLDDSHGMFDEFETRLTASGISYQRRRYPELAHEIPPDFPKLLNETLEYLYA